MPNNLAKQTPKQTNEAAPLTTLPNLNLTPRLLPQDTPQPFPFTQQNQQPSAPMFIGVSKERVLVKNDFKKFSQALLKLGYIVGFVIVFALSSSFITKKIISGQTVIESSILLRSAYQPIRVKDIGDVFEPIIEIPIIYPNKGVNKISFLLDSGAVISALPREEAKNLGYDSLAKLQRSTFRGFGGTLSFAYLGEMNVLLGEEQKNIPVVFTDASGTKALLGRSGFFEQYSVHFNAKDEVIEIRTK